MYYLKENIYSYIINQNSVIVKLWSEKIGRREEIYICYCKK